MKKIAVLVSGGGTNLQVLIDAQNAGGLGGGEIALVVSTSSSAYALERARQNNLPTVVLSKKDYPDTASSDTALLEILEQYEIELIVLAGFLRIFGTTVTEKYRHRILNTHPALLPSFGGKGFYGLHVHQAVLEAGVKVTGSTVHFVNDVVDGGEIVLQKAVDVLDDDTPESLQRRVLEEAEWVILPEAVRLFCQGRIRIQGNRTVLWKEGTGKHANT